MEPALQRRRLAEQVLRAPLEVAETARRGRWEGWVSRWACERVEGPFANVESKIPTHFLSSSKFSTDALSASCSSRLRLRSWSALTPGFARGRLFDLELELVAAFFSCAAAVGALAWLDDFFFAETSASGE